MFGLAPRMMRAHVARGAQIPARRQMSTGPAAAYDRMLGKHPITVKSVTSMVIVGLGDVFAQKVIEKRKELQLRRLANMSFLGLALIGPAMHFWYVETSAASTHPLCTAPP